MVCFLFNFGLIKLDQSFVRRCCRVVYCILSRMFIASHNWKKHFFGQFRTSMDSVQESNLECATNVNAIGF